MTIVRRPILVLAPLAVLVIVLALATNVLPLREIISQRQEIADTQARLDTLVAGNAELERRAVALETPIEVERLARDELGYIRPGEEAFVVIEQEVPAPPVTTAPPADTVVASTAEGFFSRMWAFMTGRDLAG